MKGTLGGVGSKDFTIRWIWGQVYKPLNGHDWLSSTTHLIPIKKDPSSLMDGLALEGTFGGDRYV